MNKAPDIFTRYYKIPNQYKILPALEKATKLRAIGRVTSVRISGFQPNDTNYAWFQGSGC